MKKINLWSLLVAFTAVFAMTSCMDDNKEDTKVLVQLKNYFNVYTHVNGSTQEMSSNVSYDVVYNYTKATANIAMTGIKMPGSTNIPSVTFTGLPLKENGAWRTVTAATPVPSDFNLSVAFSNLTFNVADRQVLGYYVPATVINYTMGEWQVNSFPSLYLATAKPKVTDPEGKTYEPDGDAAEYSFSYDPEKRTCVVSIQNISFSPSMPAQSIRFKDIPFNAAGNTLSASRSEAFNPYVLTGNDSETPFKAGEVSNFRATYTSSNGAEMAFDFTMAGKTYSVVMSSLYNAAD